MRREREAAEGTGKKKGKKGVEGEGTEQGSPSSDFTNWPLHSFAYNCFSFSVISLIIGLIAICIGSFYRFDLLLTYAAQNVWGLNTRSFLLIIVWRDFPIFIHSWDAKHKFNTLGGIFCVVQKTVLWKHVDYSISHSCDILAVYLFHLTVSNGSLYKTTWCIFMIFMSCLHIGSPNQCPISVLTV